MSDYEIDQDGSFVLFVFLRGWHLGIIPASLLMVIPGRVWETICRTEDLNQALLDAGQVKGGNFSCFLDSAFSAFNCRCARTYRTYSRYSTNLLNKWMATLPNLTWSFLFSSWVLAHSWLSSPQKQSYAFSHEPNYINLIWGESTLLVFPFWSEILSTHSCSPTWGKALEKVGRALVWKDGFRCVSVGNVVWLILWV